MAAVYVSQSVLLSPKACVPPSLLHIPQILPFLPLTLVLNSSLPSSSPYYYLEPYPLSDLQIGWPPNPALTLCIAPWVRAVYVSLRRRIFRAVLGQTRTPITSPATPTTVNGGHPPVGTAVNLPGEADFARNRQRNRNDYINNNEPHAANDAALPQQQQQHQPQFAALLDNGEVNHRRAVFTVSSASRMIAGSFLFPGMAAAAGSALLWLAKRQSGNGRGLLAKLLGLGLVGGGSSATAANAALALPGTIWSTFLQPAVEKVAIDPVWWRNAVGGALVIVVKDAWSICRQVMELQRANSRRIQNQTFRDGLEV